MEVMMVRSIELSRFSSTESARRASVSRLALDRRSFLAAGGACALGAGLPRAAAFAASPLLTVGTRTIEVGGKAATVYAVLGPDGRPGITASEGDRFSGLLLNATSDPLVMHWHGQVLASAEQDRARPEGGELGANAGDRHDFALTPGTHWMHSHQLTEQQLLAAPMVVREKDAGDTQDVVLMLHDFTFRSPADVLADLGRSTIHGATGAGSQSTAGQEDHAAMGHGSDSGNTTSDMSGSSATSSGMDDTAMMPGGLEMGGRMVHANDVAYDAYLANDRTLDDPEVVRVDKGGRVRLRVINGASATAFFIDTGAIDATCIAVDGCPCQPHSGRRFPIAEGQRIDLVFDIPKDGGSFPVVAQVEAAQVRTGIVLATASSPVSKLAGLAPEAAGHTDLSLDEQLRAVSPLAGKPADKVFQLLLGEEPGYRWTIDGRIHGEHRALPANLGDRVELVFNNPTSMMHPMHLHGHHFQVVATRGARFSGPMRDTVIVPPRSPVTVAVDLDKPGRWFLHCHHFYHMEKGMMTEIRVT